MSNSLYLDLVQNVCKDYQQFCLHYFDAASEERWNKVMSSILSLTQYVIGGDELGLIELFDYSKDKTKEYIQFGISNCFLVFKCIRQLILNWLREVSICHLHMNIMSPLCHCQNDNLILIA